MPEIPKELQRAGIRRVSTNRQGRAVRVNTSQLFRLFQEELMERFTRQAEPDEAGDPSGIRG